MAVIGSVALVGSSNFTVSGLTQNVELNIQIRAPGDVTQLQQWFEKHWAEGEDISEDVIRVIQRQIAEKDDSTENEYMRIYPKIYIVNGTWYVWQDNPLNPDWLRQ